MCPSCGNLMVLRTASRGDNKGNQFWGCSDFPKCRGVRALMK
ncbi:topoisomerase DNA-binding C4 zinc finger domain-containing protein [Aeromonas dhakensis]